GRGGGSGAAGAGAGREGVGVCPGPRDCSWTGRERAGELAGFTACGEGDGSSTSLEIICAGVSGSLDGVGAATCATGVDAALPIIPSRCSINQTRRRRSSTSLT